MSPRQLLAGFSRIGRDVARRLGLTSIPVVPVTIMLACIIGLLGGFGAVLFTWLIQGVADLTVEPILAMARQATAWKIALCMVPAFGLLLVSWFTRSYAPEAQGHGVPEVILAVARHDGVIRPRVSIVKILASGICIGTGGSIGREGPIVQIGAALGSMGGQLFRLSPRTVKVLVASGAAAGISATFNAPLAGVMFASEIILGSFAAEGLAPIVVSSVLADVVQRHYGEHGSRPAFHDLHHVYQAGWAELPSYFLLGLLCGLVAVGFTKLLYATEDFSNARIKRWWMRALVWGGVVGLAGAAYPLMPPRVSPAMETAYAADRVPMPPLFGVGYGVVNHTLHLENADKPPTLLPQHELPAIHEPTEGDLTVTLDRSAMIMQLWWLLPLVLLKPLMTSLTLAGGGSGGIFAPSLFIGATLGAAFGLICNLFLPGISANPGVYAVVGMGAVVAGTTHGTLSAILIVYEMTGNYRIILPIMIAAGLAAIVARLIDRDSIYEKKLTRRKQQVARGHEMTKLEHIMVRDVMIRDFPTVQPRDNLTEIVRVAREHPHIESLPVMTDHGELIGIIRPGDLQRVLDSDVPPHLVNAEDIAMTSPLAIRTNANLIEALRDFGAADIESLPVRSPVVDSPRIVGLLLRSDVMNRYRQEMLRL